MQTLGGHMIRPSKISCCAEPFQCRTLASCRWHWFLARCFPSFCVQRWSTVTRARPMTTTTSTTSLTTTAKLVHHPPWWALVLFASCVSCFFSFCCLTWLTHHVQKYFRYTRVDHPNAGRFHRSATVRSRSSRSKSFVHGWWRLWPSRE